MKSISFVGLFLSTSLVILAQETPQSHKTDAKQSTINGMNLALYPTKWQLAEDVFIGQAQEIGNKRISQQRSALWTPLGIGAATLGATFGFIMLDQLLYNGKISSLKLGVGHMDLGIWSIIATLFVVPISSLVLIFKNESNIRPIYDSSERNQYELVISRWQELREYFPEEIQKMFDLVAQLKESNSPNYAASLDRVMKMTKDAIHKNKVAEYHSLNKK